MPFQETDFASFNAYKAKFPAEARSVGSSGHFVLFKPCKFGDGQSHPALLVTKTPNKGLELFLKRGGSTIKASGSCAFAEGKLTLTVATGEADPGDVQGLGVPVEGLGQGTPPQTQTQDTGTQGGQTQTQTQPTTPQGFQRVRPQQQQPQGESHIGTGQREGIAKFLKARQDYLEYCRGFDQSMTEFRERAEAALARAASLVERAEGGERSDPLLRALQAAQKSLQEIRDAMHNAHEEQGKEVATLRGINPGTYDLEGTVAQQVGKRGQPILTQGSDFARKAGATHHETVSRLDESLRAVELSQRLAQPGQQVDRQGALLGYVDSVLQLIDVQAGNIARNYRLENTLDGLERSLQQGVGPEDLARQLQTCEEFVSSKVDKVQQAHHRVEALCKSALQRIKQVPNQNDPAVRERFTKVSAALQQATGQKREQHEQEKRWENLQQQVQQRLG